MKPLKQTLNYTALLLTATLLAGCPLWELKKMPPEQAAKVGAQPPVYDAPDIIGTLGGRKVRMNAYQVQDISYTDTPGAFAKEWATYEAPERTYDSQLVAFGFYMHYLEGRPRDLRTDNNFSEEDARKASPWVLVGVQSNNDIMSRPGFWTSILEKDLKAKPALPSEAYVKIPEIQYGLQRYVVPDKNPETGEPLDFGYLSRGNDLFVAFDEDGNVRSYIKCSHKLDVPNPPCRHEFRIMKDGLKVTLTMGHSRHLLHDWRKIEAAATDIVFGFVKNAETDPVNSIQPNRSK